MDRLLSVRRELLTIATVLLVGSSAALAQSMTVEAPPGQLAQPGDYVTLVFLVRSASTATFALQATSSHGWQLLGPQSTITISGGSAAPVAVTLEVPQDASAADPDEVTLTAVGGGQQASATVAVDIARHLSLRLVTPQQVALGGELVVTVDNAGNVTASASVRVTTTKQTVGIKTVTVDPGKKVSVSFAVAEEAQYQVQLERGKSVLAVRYVDTIVQGSPKPSTFSLSGTTYASLSSDLTWQAALHLEGQVSDYTHLKLDLQPNQPLASSTLLQSEHFGVQLGDLSTDPLGLPALGGFGVSTVFTPASTALEGSATWLGADRFAGRLAVGYRRDLEDVRVVAGVGLQGSNLAIAGSMNGTVKGGHAALSAAYDGERLSASFNMNARDSTGTYSVTTSLLDGLTAYSRFSTWGNFRSGHTTVYVTGTAALASEAASQIQAGLSTRLATVGNASINASIALGEPESLASMTYGGGNLGPVRFSVSGGTLYRTDGSGWGASGDVQLDVGTSSGQPGWKGGLEARAHYFPADGQLQGRVSAKTLGELAPYTLFASSGWDLGTGSVGLNTGVIFSRGRWNVQGNWGGSYDPGSLEPWSVQLKLQARVAIDVVVPEPIVQLAGGRRLGTLSIHAQADGKPLAGVGLAVGRYRLDTGPDGTAVLRLPPSTVTVGIDLAKLAVNLQLVGSSTRTVTLKDRTTTNVTFTLQRTSAVRGHVLVDANGDGTADPGAGGVKANLVVEDALGQTHSATAAADGSYLVRGLPSGSTTIAIASTPQGSVVVGPAKRVLKLAPGGTGTANFLVELATSRATVFDNHELRIREVIPEVTAAPPGSSPVFSITTVGHPDKVVALVDGVTFPARRVQANLWQVRVPVTSKKRSVEHVDVRATKGNQSTGSSGQVVVDPSVPLMKAAPLGIVRAGGTAHLEVHVLFDASSVVASLDGGTDFPLRQEAPGQWQTALPIPPHSSAGIHEVSVSAVARDGTTTRTTVRVRVATP